MIDSTAIIDPSAVLGKNVLASSFVVCMLDSALTAWLLQRIFSVVRGA